MVVVLLGLVVSLTSLFVHFHGHQTASGNMHQAAANSMVAEHWQHPRVQEADESPRHAIMLHYGDSLDIKHADGTDVNKKAFAAPKVERQHGADGTSFSALNRQFAGTMPKLIVPMVRAMLSEQVRGVSLANFQTDLHANIQTATAALGHSNDPSHFENGWTYMWNARGSIREVANYDPMYLKEGVGFVPHAGKKYPSPDEAGWAKLGESGRGHPGRGSLENGRGYGATLSYHAPGYHAQCQGSLENDREYVTAFCEVLCACN